MAHVIHTGGSTGAPKAVVCAHRGSLASHAARAATHPYVADDVTGVCVFGVWDAVCALLAGSKVAMLPPESITDGGDVLGRYLCDNKVTRTMLTPSLAELLVAAAAHAESVHAREALDAMRVVVLCGETPRVGLVDALLSSQPDETDEEYSKSRVVANLYSVSEAHDVALEPNLGSAVQEGHLRRRVVCRTGTSTWQSRTTTGVYSPRRKVKVGCTSPATGLPAGTSGRTVGRRRDARSCRGRGSTV